MKDKRFLLVSGAGRSGTSVLGRMLSAHPDICILVERFSLENWQGTLTEALFTRENISDDNLWEKFQRSALVGDKIPGIFDIEKVDEGFDEPLYIYILRDPVAVGMSWQDRADSTTDPWSPARNRLESLIHQRGCLEAITRAPFKNRIILMSYKWAFSQPGNIIENLNLLAEMVGARPAYTKEILATYIEDSSALRADGRASSRRTHEERWVEAVRTFYPHDLLDELDRVGPVFADQIPPEIYGRIQSFYAAHQAMEVQVRTLSESWGLPTLTPRNRHIDSALAAGRLDWAIVQAVRWHGEVAAEKQGRIRTLIYRLARQMGIDVRSPTALPKALRDMGHPAEAEACEAILSSQPT